MKKQIKKAYNEHKVDIILFVLSGFMAFLADFAVLQIVDAKTHKLLLATALGIFSGFLISYTLNHLRFKIRHEQSRSVKESFPLFAALFVFNTLFTFACLTVNDNNFQLPRIVVKAGTVGCIMIWNYILFHYIVFRKDNHTKEET